MKNFLSEYRTLRRIASMSRRDSLSELLSTRAHRFIQFINCWFLNKHIVKMSSYPYCIACKRDTV